MEAVVHILGLFLLFSACALALLSLLFGLPGTFLIVGAALVYAWATDFATVQWSTIGWLVLLAVVGELLELAATAASAGAERPSWRVTALVLLGGLVGGIIGTPILFGIGSLLGALLGAFAGATVAVALEGGSTDSALRTGLAAMRGRFLGFVLKSSVAAVMLIVVAVAAL